MQQVPFVTVLAYLEERGWDFTGFWRDLRVFKKPGRETILVRVQDRTISHEAFESIKKRVEGKDS